MSNDETCELMSGIKCCSWWRCQCNAERSSWPS